MIAATERAPVPTDTRCTPCRSGSCLERRDITTGECMALKIGREIIAESGGGRAGTIPHRRTKAVQLDLFDLPPSTRWDDDEDDADLVAAGILRHGQLDTDDHQRGWIVLDWDTAGGQKKGDLIPAWICCACGDPEPNRYWLSLHSCYLIPGCVARPRRPDTPWQFRLADPELVARHLATLGTARPSGGADAEA